MNEFKAFGSPDRFEIAARWIADPQRRERLPMTEGWSTAEFRITVGNRVLTDNRQAGASKDHLSWYLSPIVDWLIASWTWLLHEEGFAWVDKTGAPAALATLSSLERNIGSSSDAERRIYEQTQLWWHRHALRAADSSALYPDIYFRRVADDIEVSWLARQPAYAPDGFALTLLPGFATLPVRAVAEPLWQFLDWATRSPVVASADDQAIVASLRGRFESLKRTPLDTLEMRYVGERVQGLLEHARNQNELDREREPVGDIPIIEYLNYEVLMFGGVSVDIGEPDVKRLLKFLKKQRGGSETERLTGLTTNPTADAWLPPYEEGYRLAEDIREALDIAPDELRIDVEHVLEQLHIHVEEVELDTDSIRGVAIAGHGFTPAILVNLRSAYNANEAGRRFTLAHELCHILIDRTRAKKLSHVSGPWASTRTEKRANAFAAMFLASTPAMNRSLASRTVSDIHGLAKIVGINVSALVEHLYNVDLIDDVERERLRNA